MSYNYDLYYTEQYKPLNKSGYSKTDLKKYSNFSYARYRFLKRNKIIQQLSKEMKMLGIGSGIGGFEKIMKDKGFDILGSDVSAKTAEIAQNLNKNIKFIKFDVTKDVVEARHPSSLALHRTGDWPLYFDCIFSFEVLEHLENPEQAIKNISKLLKKGGYFIGTTPYQPRFKTDPTHINEKNIEQWSKIFKNAGFKILFFKDISFFPYLYRFNKFFSFCFPYKAKTENVNRYLISTQFFVVEKIN